MPNMDSRQIIPMKSRGFANPPLKTLWRNTMGVQSASTLPSV